MGNLPPIKRPHRVYVICEGYEDYNYFDKLLKFNFWSDIYKFDPINAKGASNIFPRYQNAYSNGRGEVILIFGDTDKAPYREYSLLKKKINEHHGVDGAADKVIMFANPCTMQIVLSHFDDILLKNQGKKTNSDVIQRLTGVEGYDAHEDQIKAVCAKIKRSSYDDMKARISKLNNPDTVSGSTNFITFLERFESDDCSWIKEINDYIG